MRKVLVLALIVILCACGRKIGNFQDGTMDLRSLYGQIQKEIIKENWEIAILNDEPLAMRDVESLYHLDMQNIEECYIWTSLLGAELSEIAFFKAEDTKDEICKEAIQSRMQDIEKMWGSYLVNFDQIKRSARQGRIGQYYYFILGVDSEKVVNYMKDL